MSASSTIYSMAAEAEQPHLLRQLEHAHRGAEAEASAPPRSGILRNARRWLGAGIARPWLHLVNAGPAAAARATAVVRATEAASPPS